MDLKNLKKYEDLTSKALTDLHELIGTSDGTNKSLSDDPILITQKEYVDAAAMVTTSLTREMALAGYDAERCLLLGMAFTNYSVELFNKLTNK